MKLQEIDEKITEQFLMMSFYEVMSRFIVSIGSAPLPKKHPMASIFIMNSRNDTIAKHLTKTLKTKIEKFIQGSKTDVFKLNHDILDQRDKCQVKSDKLIIKRQKM